MTEISNDPLASIKQNLDHVFSYLENLERLDRRPVFDIATSKELTIYEHQMSALLGVSCWRQDAGTESWFTIKRLQPTGPPAPDEELVPWVGISNDPNVIPILKEMIVVAADDFSSDDDGDKSGNDKQPAETIVFRLDECPEIQNLFDEYIENLWSPWSESEKLRRQTIALYEQLFRFIHQSTDEAVELVLGMGMLRWRKQETRINHPVITKIVEAVIDPETKTITIFPTQRPPKSELEILQHVSVSKIIDIETRIEQLMDGLETEVFPFVPETFSAILHYVAANIDSKSLFWPDENTDPADRSLPDIQAHPIVTDSWVLFVRQRKTNFIAEDIKRLKNTITQAASIPMCTQVIVSEPADVPLDRPIKSYRGLSSIGFESWVKGGGRLEPENLYFPKPFNEEQVSVIERLDQADGVVVQGPPGTGKTHTIANIICHFLANGKRVLVTSHKEAQLAVLRNHIPAELREFTTALLTSDREGLKALEQSVRKIASEVNSINRSSLQSEISRLKEHIDGLYEKIAAIDANIRKIAKTQLSNVPLFAEEISPRDLAIKVVEGKDAYGWFDEYLTPDESSKPQFSDEDVRALRTAREALGDDIEYLRHKFPEPDVLATDAVISFIHQNIVKADRLADKMKTDGIPELLDVSSGTMAKIKKAHAAAIRVDKILNGPKNEKWLCSVQQIWRRQCETGQQTAVATTIETIISEAKSLEEKRCSFYASPIEIPPDCDLDEKFVAAVTQKAASKSSFFGMLRKKELKEKLKLVKIDGVLPKTADDWEKVLACTQLLIDSRKTLTRWNQLAREFNGPTINETGLLAIGRLNELCTSISNLRAIETKFFPEYTKFLTAVFPGAFTADRIKASLSESIWVLETHEQYNAFQAALNDKNLQLKKLAGYSGPVVDEITNFIQTQVGSPDFKTPEILEKLIFLRQKLETLQEKKPLLRTVSEATNLIRKSGAKKWAKRLCDEPFDENEDRRLPISWRLVWDWALSVSYLKKIDGRKHFQKLSQERIQCESDLAKANLRIVEILTWLKLKDSITGKASAALRAYLTAIQRIGKSKDGVRSTRFREDARKAMLEAYEAIPCWIMPHWRVSESLPPQIGSFDLVIIDEASQSDAYALPAIIRGKKILVVGDDKQVSPSDVARREADILYLRDKHLRALPYGHLLLPGSSIYDLCSTLFSTDVIRLREHFRCVEPIIAFSNRNFYEGELRPVRIPKPSERLDPSLIDVYVPGGNRRGKSKLNKPEARAIIDEIMRLTKDPRFSGRSIGVVSLLGFEQAQYIQNKIYAKIGEDAILSHDIKCGDASYFQGKEADIVMISMVAAGKIQAQTSRIIEQRYNVAASRARDRLYLFRSFERNQITDTDLRARLLDHFSNPQVQGCGEIKELRALCESDFEREVFDELVGRGYLVRPQVNVGNYRIDLVVEGHEDARLAVELDGDKYHGIERWLEDISRQRTLERMNWVFWRCWGSNYISDKDECLAELLEKLDSVKIEPIGYDQTGVCSLSEQRVVTEDEVYIHEPAEEPIRPDVEGDTHVFKEKDESEALPPPVPPEPSQQVPQPNGNGHQTESYVQINDTVTYAYLDRPDEKKMVQIVRGRPSTEEGIISHNSPIAQTLLGAFRGEKVTVGLPTGDKEIIVLDIVKN